MTLDQQLLDIALEGLAKNKPKVEKVSKLAEKLANDLSTHKDLYKADKDALNSRLNTFTDDFKKELESTLKSIPIPKDGKNGIDGKSGKDGKDGEKGSTGPRGIQGAQGPKGDQGKPGSPGQVGPTGAKGKDGINGYSGEDGVGIVNISSKHSKLLIELDNGKVIDIKLPEAKSIPAGVTAMPTEIVVMRNLADTNVDNATEGQVLTLENGKWVGKTLVAGEGDAVTLEHRIEIESMFKVAETTAYKELIYDQETQTIITNVDIYTNNSKTTKLFSKVIGYNNGNITSISITDEVNSGTLNKTLVYTDGNLESVSSTYTV